MNTNEYFALDVAPLKLSLDQQHVGRCAHSVHDLPPFLPREPGFLHRLWLDKKSFLATHQSTFQGFQTVWFAII